MKRITFRIPEAPNADRVVKALYYCTIIWAIGLFGFLAVAYAAML